MPILIIALILALASGGGVVYAAKDASPGQALYSVKTVTERVEQIPQVATVSLSRVLGRGADTKTKDNENEDTDEDTIESDDEITGTVRLTDTKSITDSNWYSHTVSAISAISGTTGLTLTDTLSNVVGLADDDNVPGHSYQGLAAKLRAAAESLDRGKPEVAAHQLDAFLHELDAMKRSGHIDPANYDKLLANYNELVAALQGTVQSARPSPHSAKANKGRGGKDDLDTDDDGVTTTVTSTITSGVGTESHGGGSGGKGKPADVPRGKGHR